MPSIKSLAWWGLAVVVTGTASCQNPKLTQDTFFDRRIAPILDENCVRGTADNLCHAESTQKPGEALGNLDLSSFEAVQKRPELLRAYGSYSEPIMLLKSVKPEEVVLQYEGETFESEIVHAGGGILSRNSEAFIELQQWLSNGATEDGQPADATEPRGSGACSTALRPDVEPFLDLATGVEFDSYSTDVEPILRSSCAFGSCHGSSQSDFYLTCGDTPEQVAHNFVVTKSFVAEQTDRSELLLRPLAVAAGGVNHSGGSVWRSSDDDGFQALRQWVGTVGPLEIDDDSPGFAYFEEQVMPVLLRRGCAMPQCHSPEGFNDFRLRAGSRGFFSPLALRRNYEATLAEFVSLDAADPNESRIVKKNISGEQGGIEHRAGFTLLDVSGADQGGDPSVCPPGDDAQPTSYCTIVEWIRRERAAAVDLEMVSALAPGDSVPIIYVDRPANPDRVIDFATYRGGSRLMRVDATVGERGQLDSFGVPAEIDLSPCGATGDFDVRRPEIAFEGDRMVFALRVGASDGLNIYTADLDGENCDQLTDDGGTTSDGVAVHNFDPTFIPPDPEHNPGGAIVFASTRAGNNGSAHVTPRYRLPASNLWRMALDGTALEQMTYLNGSEMFPALMQNGQVTMTTEKATSDFYQLSGRRINWDLTDYHPLLAQRETIGFGQATFIRETFDRNFTLILSDPSASFSGGALVNFNRSIGPFEVSRQNEAGYLSSLAFVDPDAANAGKGVAQGAYRSPYPAPDGTLLVSYAAGTLDLTDPSAAVDYDLVVIDPRTGERTPVVTQPGFQVDAVIAYRRSLRKVFVNIPELVFGGTSVSEAADNNTAWAHFPDLPMLATLLRDNRRGQRNFDDVRDGDTLAVYRANPPPTGNADDGSTYENWELLGTQELLEDGSAFVSVPAGVPVILELRQGSTTLLTMTEEHQFGPGEQTSLGVHRSFFDGVCGGCHGSVDGPELDVVVNPDALTGASVSLARPDAGARPTPL